MNRPIRIAIAGAGRMGRAIAAMIECDEKLALAGIWSRGEDLDALVASADLLIDFSLPEATAEVLAAVTRHRKPLVCGVSGLDESQLEAVETAATVVPVVYDRNMSTGISVLDDAVRRVAAVLGDEFEVRIEETHHARKKDAPSGTALKLGEAVAAVRGIDAMDIDYKSERRGTVPGDHSIVFEAPTEALTLAHHVTTRDVFAKGALSAAAWIVGRSPGRYSMHDVLFGR